MIYWAHTSLYSKWDLDQLSDFCTELQNHMLYDAFQWPGPPSDSWFLGPIQVQMSNRIMISSAIFAELMTITHA